MAQGAIKKLSNPAADPRKKKQAHKRAAKVTKPRKAKTSAADKVQKKYAARLVGKTEQLLGERAGHLELIGRATTAKTKKEEKKQKGGTRKFG